MSRLTKPQSRLLRIALGVLSAGALASAASAAHPNLDGPDPMTATTITDPNFLVAPSGFTFNDPNYAVATNVPTVDHTRLTRLNYTGNPWSHWGRGIVASNGKFYCAQGDHLGINSNSLLYEYNPATKQTGIAADLQQPFDPWPAGVDPNEVFPDPVDPNDQCAYGFGKVHGRISEGTDGKLYFASYYGQWRAEGLYYFGDRFFSYDPGTGTITDLGRGMVGGNQLLGYGPPSTHFDPSRGLMYAETFLKKTANWGDPNHPSYPYLVDPPYSDINDPYNVKFAVFNTGTGNIQLFDEKTNTTYGRDMFVDAQGNCYFNDGADPNGDGILKKYDPTSNSVSTLKCRMPGGHQIRRTDVDGNGILYAALQDSADLIKFDPVSETITTVAHLGYDAASLCVDHWGWFAYYIPGSHGSINGEPVVQVNLATGEQKIIAFLEYPIHDHTNHWLSGTLCGEVAPDGKTLYFMTHGIVSSTWYQQGSRWEDTALLVIHVPDAEIPEPLTLSLLAVGGGILALVRKRH